MLKEFKEFAMRGNVMDMAAGIIIGAAFGHESAETPGSSATRTGNQRMHVLFLQYPCQGEPVSELYLRTKGGLREIPSIRRVPDVPRPVEKIGRMGKSQSCCAFSLNLVPKKPVQ